MHCRCGALSPAHSMHQQIVVFRLSMTKTIVLENEYLNIQEYKREHLKACAGTSPQGSWTRPGFNFQVPAEALDCVSCQQYFINFYKVAVSDYLIYCSQKYWQEVLKFYFLFLSAFVLVRLFQLVSADGSFLQLVSAFILVFVLVLASFCFL